MLRKIEAKSGIPEGHRFEILQKPQQNTINNKKNNNNVKPKQQQQQEFHS